MRRVFSVLGFTALSSLLVFTNVNTVVAICLSATFLLCGVVFLIVKKTRKNKLLPTICITVAFFGVFLLLFSHYVVKPPQKYAQKTALVEATVVSLPQKLNNSTKCVIKTNKIGKENVSINVLAIISGFDEIEPYDKIVGEAYFKQVEKQSYGNNYSNGIYLNAIINDAYTVKATENNKSLHYNLLKLKKSAIDNVKQGMDEDLYDIGIGVLLGEKSYLDTDTYSSFKQCGIAHILAVSGLHVAIISSIVFSILLFLGINRRVAAAINIPIIFFYVALTGFSFSAIRAGVLLLVLYLGIITRYEADTLNSLGLVTLILLLINPYTALSVSYLLSFSAVLGLVIMYQPIEAKTRVWLEDKPGSISFVTNLLYLPFMQTISATLFCLPIMCVTFGYISIVSPFVNVLIAPVTQWLLAACALCAIFPSLGWLANAPTWYVKHIADKVSRFQYCTVSVDDGFFVLWIAATVILIVPSILLYKKYNKNKKFYIRFCALLSCIILQISVITNLVISKDQTVVTFLDSGVGCCAVVKRDDRAIIIGAGGSSAWNDYQNYADRYCIRYVDLMIVPNDSSWFNTETVEVARQANPSKILISDRFDNHYALKYVNDKVFDCDDSKISVWDDIEITTRHLTGTDILTLKIGNSSILFTDKNIPFNELTKKERTCDIVVFAGHVSEKYIKQINQTTVLCSKNRSEMFDADYSTCGQGDLMLYTKGHRDYVFGR